MKNDFAVFILTHKRAKNQKTLETIQKSGYTGDWFLIIDDMDEQKQDYLDRYGEKVIIFSKSKYSEKFDLMTNEKKYGAVVYARNASYDIAKRMGKKFVLMLDDDISSIHYKIKEGDKLKSYNVKNMDKLLEDMCNVIRAGNIAFFGFAEEGSYWGGCKNKDYILGVKRKIAQAMIVNVDSKTRFRGNFYEDIIASADCSINHEIAMSTMLVAVQTPVEGTNSGGMAEYYEAAKSFIPCFMMVMAYPNIAKICRKNNKFKLRISEDSFAPKIIGEKWRKKC